MKPSCLFSWMIGTLRKRLIFSVALVHAVLMTVFIIDVTQRQSDLLIERQTGQAVSLANALSVSSAGWLTSSDVSGLQELVDAQKRYPEFKFSMILNLKGEVLAHSDRSQLGRVVIDLPDDQPEMAIKVSPELVDVTSPVILSGKHVGWSRVGISQSDTKKKLGEIARGGVIYAIAAILIGSVLAWFMGNRFTSRLKSIQDVIDKVRVGILSHRVSLSGSDEAAELANGFNQMLTSLEERNVELQQSELRWQFAIEGAGDGLWDWSIPDRRVYYSPRWASIIGENQVSQELSTWEERIHPEDKPKTLAKLKEHLEGKGENWQQEHRLKMKDGSWKWVLGRGMVVARDTEGNPLRMVGTMQDITERKQLELEHQKFFLLAESSSEFIGICDLDMQPLYVNPAGLRMVGLPDMAAACQVKVQDYYFPEDQAFIRDDFFPRVLREGQDDIEIRLRHFQTGEPIWMFAYFFAVRDSSDQAIGWAIISRDITERKKEEAEREKLQLQLAQAQKMESVGRLAGGVAHDFNNMLGVILGHTELALEKTGENHYLFADLKEIQIAARRSADLTRQLLTFARKQIIEPKMLDLNQTIEGMLKMLRRLIGEDIDLVWKPSSHLWPVKMDPSQIDQILANLCVNAQDAIEGVGQLTIETGRQTFDEEYCKSNDGFIPGDFVLLAVSDNGCGMDKDTLANLFEPFFTTKDIGKGTGLGLATIYGIVKQNKGFINVYSEPGQGATFKIYLPRLLADEFTYKIMPEKKITAGGTETILLVEDEPAILEMTRKMLERKGYSVLSAATPAEAIEKAENHTEKIHLLMTDVVMPEMNGLDLARHLKRLHPDIKHLFMSGYTADVIAHRGILDEGVAFIQKPFSMEGLTEKLRGILDTASG